MPVRPREMHMLVSRGSIGFALATRPQHGSWPVIIYQTSSNTHLHVEHHASYREASEAFRRWLGWID